MHTHRNNQKRTFLVLFTLVLMLVAATSPAFAVACNTGGCWSGEVDFLKIAPDGKIWFVVVNSATLNNLVPADGCILKQIWTGQAEPALYIRADDPKADEKYTLLLTAFNTGTSIGFSPVKDPATNWCSLDSTYLR